MFWAEKIAQLIQRLLSTQSPGFTCQHCITRHAGRCYNPASKKWGQDAVVHKPWLHDPVSQKTKRASEMAQWQKLLVIQACWAELNPGPTHRWKERRGSTVIPWPPHTHCGTLEYARTHTQFNTILLDEKNSTTGIDRGLLSLIKSNYVKQEREQEGWLCV